MGISIVKKSGESILYDPAKLINSLERSGAGSDDIRFILNEVEKELYDGITTRKIYRKAYALLKRVSSGAAGRYRLKEAIMELGPTGFPFEKFVGELFRYQGYQVQTGEIVQGKCVSHEVDVIAEKENEVLMLECKFHAMAGRKSDVKVSLYIHSRFEDIRNKRKVDPENTGNRSFRGGLVTNTKFTGDAIDFGNCAGLKMISWDFPGSGSLKNRIDISGLFPITCLFSLRKLEKKQLIDRGVVMCRELCEKPELINNLGVTHVRFKRILQEVTAICNSKSND
jgi:hypothetical protein